MFCYKEQTIGHFYNINQQMLTQSVQVQVNGFQVCVNQRCACTMCMMETFLRLIIIHCYGKRIVDEPSDNGNISQKCKSCNAVQRA